MGILIPQNHLTLKCSVKFELTCLLEFMAHVYSCVPKFIVLNNVLKQIQLRKTENKRCAASVIQVAICYLCF